MKKRPDEILRDPYSRVLIPEEDGTISAEILEFPGCFAQGQTANEAFDNLEKAAKVWIEASLAQGLNIPSPTLNQNYSGKIALRMPRSLHKRAAQMAARDATSLNQFLITAIASRIGAEEYHAYLSDNFKNLLTCNIANTVSVKSTLQQNFVTINPLPFYYIRDIKQLQDDLQSPFQNFLPGLTYKDIDLISYESVQSTITLIPQATNAGR